MNDQIRYFDAAKASLDGSRRCNQDRCLVLQDGDTVLLALADGLGGHPRGEVAAQLLVDVCETRFRNTSKPLFDPEHFMLQCIGKAHRSILRFGRRLLAAARLVSNVPGAPRAEPRGCLRLLPGHRLTVVRAAASPERGRGTAGPVV